MGFKLNPFTGNLDTTDSPNGVFEEIEVNGDITLDGRFISSLNGALSDTGIAGVPVAATGTWITGGTATTTKPQVLIEPTGTTSTAWSTSGTGIGVNAASGFAGNLLDLQVNGSRAASVSSTLASFPQGNATNTPGIAFIGATSYGIGTDGSNLALYANSVKGLNISPSVFQFRIPATYEFAWSSSTANNGGADLSFFRDAADTLAQRRTTNAQTSRVYGTYTDASNYVRAALSSTSTAVTLAAETAGTGADDIPLNLTAAGTGTVKVNSVAEVVVSSIVAGLPAAPVVGMLTRVTDATAPAVGSTVAGGGAAAALVWYNGANWSVIGV